MPFNVAIVIAAFIIMNTVIAMTIFIKKRRREAQEDEMKHAASSRGWQFESTSEQGYRVHRWKGTNDGIAWIAEDWHYASNNRKQNRPDVARMHVSFSPGINQPIVLMGLPPGATNLAERSEAAAGDGIVARLAQKALDFAFDKAIDLYFGKAIGKEVDAAALHRVNIDASGFVVMAADKDEGLRVMQQGLQRALADATKDPTSILADANRPSILLRSAGISLANIGRLKDAAEIERMARTGTALTRAFTFGRRR